MSLSTKRYTVDDFSEIPCVEVVDLTESIWEHVVNHVHTENCNRKLETNEEDFNRILKLTIANTGKAQVIDGIRKIEERDDVISAEPNYLNNSIASVPNDPDLDFQWSVEKINLIDAWNVEKGGNDVLIGVVDTGIDNSHPDLVNRVNTNLSCDFTPETVDPFLDKVSHGTHVAGIIGAEGNNYTGISGVCWTSNLVSLKISNTASGFLATNVISAITYATAKNIPILNLSLSLSDSINLREAIENYPGLIICAAGNQNVNIDTNRVFPASYTYDNVLTVGASTSSDVRAYFSNYGKSNVDIFAPGYEIYSTVPVNNGSYTYMSGTSMATPFVTGVAALLLSHDNTLTAKNLKESILNNCDSISSLQSYCVTGGRLNAYKALVNAHKHDYRFDYVSISYHQRDCACGYSDTVFHSFENSYCVDCGFYYHSHDYNAPYTWVDYTHHLATCECGNRIKRPHAVSSGSFSGVGNKYATCLLCGGSARMGFVQAGIKENQLVTENGSYVLPNGVIVLVDEDSCAYLNGTLVFYGSNVK